MLTLFLTSYLPRVANTEATKRPPPGEKHADERNEYCLPQKSTEAHVPGSETGKRESPRAS